MACGIRKESAAVTIQADILSWNRHHGNPGDAKYGMTKPQIFEAFKRLKREGVKEFGIHSFLASNTVSNEYYPALASILFNLAVELKENLGVHIGFNQLIRWCWNPLYTR